MIRLATSGSNFGWFAPNIGNLPGGGSFQQLTNGLGGFVLVGLLFGGLMAAGAWAIGGPIGNVGLAERGKQGVIAVVLIALLVGGLPRFLDFFYGVGVATH